MPARTPVGRTRRRRGLLVGFAFGVATAIAPAAAMARPSVTWRDVEVRAGDDGPRVARLLRRELKRASKHEDWRKGSGKSAKRRPSSSSGFVLSAKVVALTWTPRGDDVVRVAVTVVARIEEGPRNVRRQVRSHIRLGGHPRHRNELERRALKIVAGGIVTRLAEVARR
ncbi:MAG: hypothetical protein AAGN82_08055 [Myxococcota bacterium]